MQSVWICTDREGMSLEKVKPIAPATVSRKYQPSFYELAAARSQ